MSLSNSALQKIQNLAQSIIDLITTHANTTATSSQKGHVQSSNLVQDVSVDGTSNVGTDNGYYALADHKHKISNASTSAYGITKLSNSVTSTSQVLAATPKAVKTAYDLANGKPDLGITSTTAAAGNHTHDYSKVSVSQTKTSGIEIGKVTIDGVETSLYQQDNNTTYTAASATPTADTSSGAVGTSSKYAREDHIHPQSNLYAEANHNHDGTYLKSYTPPTASTSAAGIVQLNNTVTSSSTTEAATANAVKIAYDKGNHTHSYAPSSHTSVTANSTTLGHVKAGTNVGAADTANGSAGTATSGLFAPADHVHKQSNLYATSGHTHSIATSSANGLMSSSDKSNIDNTPIIRYGTLSGTTSAFTLSINGISNLVHGTLIACYNAVGNSVSGATLKVNDFDALPIYYKASAITGSYLQNKTFNIFMYNNQIVNTGCWQLLYGYDSNTKYTAASAISGADTASGAVGTSANYARQDHSHPQSTLYAEATHTHNEYAELAHNHILSDISDSIEYYSGVNMLKGTRLFTAPDVCPSESTINGTYYDCNVRYMQNTSSTSHLTYEYYIPYSNIVNGEYYTLSFWAKTTTAHDFIQIYWYLANNSITKRIASNSTYTGQNGESDSFSDGQTRFAITTNWKRYYVVYQTNPNPSNTSSNRRLLIRLNKNNNQNDLYLAGVKFERGNKPTPYSENVMDYVGDAITYINQ